MNHLCVLDQLALDISIIWYFCSRVWFDFRFVFGFRCVAVEFRFGFACTLYCCVEFHCFQCCLSSDLVSRLRCGFVFNFIVFDVV